MIFYPYFICDAIYGNQSEIEHVTFSVFYLTESLERHILLKTPPESYQWFQSYKQLKGSQNNRKQKEIN